MQAIFTNAGLFKVARFAERGGLKAFSRVNSGLLGVFLEAFLMYFGGGAVFFSPSLRVDAPGAARLVRKERCAPFWHVILYFVALRDRTSSN